MQNVSICRLPFQYLNNIGCGSERLLKIRELIFMLSSHLCVYLLSEIKNNRYVFRNC